ncbi:hypothetical protein H6CHR_00129 [Variovorax sp. PBL-H6]|uniref:hypothetical protein n=1 Tax=Variovorax sp. PBL-H6 TaxID=434009 RepID=UPI00131772FB|nr:hypothetical protein [Variovorax sp. PBL-H6]VTU15131.1 hypothetical protein H6CHR_00129 [Variovorax sp. PBL-H6]
MRQPLLISLALAACCAAALAQTPKLPVESNDEGSIYVSPNLSPTEKAATANGGTLGLQRKDGSGAYGGVDTSGSRPNYSLGASTGGDVSFSAGAHTDGKENMGIKAGVMIRY